MFMADYRKQLNNIIIARDQATNVLLKLKECDVLFNKNHVFLTSISANTFNDYVFPNHQYLN